MIILYGKWKINPGEPNLITRDVQKRSFLWLIAEKKLETQKAWEECDMREFSTAEMDKHQGNLRATSKEIQGLKAILATE